MHETGSLFCRVKELNELGKENIPKRLISHTHLIYSSPATLAFNSPGAEGFGVKRAGLAVPGSIMLIVHRGFYAIMNMCSSEYMNILYTGLTGRLVMTVALMVYAAALWTGHKILDIHV